MTIFSLLLVFLAFESSTSTSISNSTIRVFGGQDGSDGQFPYVAFHLVQTAMGGFSTCTAGIIGPRWVLTAAHCITPGLVSPNQHLVAAGKADLNNYLRARRNMVTFYTNINEAAFDVQERRAEAVYYNPEFNAYGRGRDIGLLKVNKPFVFNNRVSAMPISRRPFTPASNCVITGYGLSENNARKNKIQYVTGASAVPSQQCTFGKSKDVICLGERSRGICKGDSGGPLACGNSIVGVASVGITTGGQQQCGRGVLEMQYTDVQKNLYWIDRFVGSN